MTGRGPGESSFVQVRRTIGAPAAEVFRAWTEPQLVRQWFKPRGGSSPSAEMDVRVGGTYRWAMKLLGHVYYAVGEYVEIDPPERLVFTLSWERALVQADDSLVTVEFADHGDRTEVIIIHERLANRPMRTLHGLGWRDMLRNLGQRLGRPRASSSA